MLHLLICCLSVLVHVAEDAPAAPYVLNKIVAIVEDDVITLRDLQKMAKANPNPTLQDYRNLLEQEIAQRLIHRAIKQAPESLRVTDKDIDKAIEEVQRQNGIDRPTLESSLYAQGIDMASYRLTLKEQIERARLMQYQLQGKVQIDHQNLQSYCQRQHSSAPPPAPKPCMLALTLPATAPNAQATMAALRERALKGESLASFAKHAHTLTYTELGCVELESMLDAFREALGNLKAKEISRVFAVEQTLYLIQISHFETSNTPTAARCSEDAYLETLKPAYYEEEMTRQFQLWQKKLRQKAFVDIKL
jgi:peptidyl-prolyl cis-trans isomerase SurA